MKNPQHIHTHLPWFTLAGTGCMVLLFLILGAAPEALVYNRDAIAQGELWRLITGHIVHCDIEHLVWNITAFLILGSLAEQRLGWRTMGLAGASCLGVSGWLWFFNTDLTLYCGLSGALNGVLVVVLASLWSETRQPIIPLITMGSAAKIVIEIMSHHSIFTDISWSSVPEAHGAGFVVGLLYLWGMQRPKQTFHPSAFFPRIMCNIHTI